VAYHATRLLPEEIDEIRRQGIRPLDCDLIDQKLAIAVSAGHLTAEEAQRLSDGSRLSTARSQFELESRAGQVCLVLRRSVFDTHVQHFMRIWGGEALNYTKAGEDLGDRLRRMGQPAIIVAHLPHTPATKMRVHPSLTTVFVSRIQVSNMGADLIWREVVPAARIADIWTPGHPEFDCHQRVPAE
jgi:hypothetical protein